MAQPTNWITETFTSPRDAVAAYADNRNDLVTLLKGPQSGLVPRNIVDQMSHIDAYEAVDRFFLRASVDNRPQLQAALLQFAREREDMWSALSPQYRPGADGGGHEPSAAPQLSVSSPEPATTTPSVPLLPFEPPSSLTASPQHISPAVSEPAPPSSSREGARSGVAESQAPSVAPQTSAGAAERPLDAHATSVQDRASDEGASHSTLPAPPFLQSPELDVLLGGHRLRLDCVYLKYNRERGWWSVRWQLFLEGGHFWHSMNITGTVTERKGRECRIIAKAPEPNHNDPGEAVTGTITRTISVGVNFSHAPSATPGVSWAAALAQTSYRTMAFSTPTPNTFEIDLASSAAKNGIMQDIAWELTIRAPQEARLAVQLSLTAFEKHKQTVLGRNSDKPGQPHQISSRCTYTIDDEHGAEELEAQTALNARSGL